MVSLVLSFPSLPLLARGATDCSALVLLLGCKERESVCVWLYRCHGDKRSSFLSPLFSFFLRKVFVYRRSGHLFVDMEASTQEGQQQEQAAAVNTASLEYARSHKLHELVDELISEVAAARPDNPVAFMGAVLQKKIATRKAENGETDARLAAALPMLLPSRRANTQSSADSDVRKQSDRPMKEQSLAQFGIWVHIRYMDVPEVVARFQSMVFSRSLTTPTEVAENLEVFLQMLAAAAATAHFKGLAEALKLLPTRTVHLTPQLFKVLADAVLASAPNATASQRTDFLSFIEQIARVQSGTSAVEDAMAINAVCATLHSNEALWSRFLSVVQKAMTRLDPVMATHNASFTMFVHDLVSLSQHIIEDSKGFQLYEDGDALKRRVQFFYQSAVKEVGDEGLPDQYAVFAAFFFYGLQCTLNEGQLTPTATHCLGNILGCVMDLVNTIAAETYGERRCVRKSDMSIVRGCLRFLSVPYCQTPFSAGATAGFENAHSQSADTLLRSAATPHGAYSDQMADSFIKVASLVVAAQRGRSGGGGGGGGASGGGGGTILQTESLVVRCYHEAYRALLPTLISLVRLRTAMTAKRLLTIVARSLCFGAPPENLYVHFQDAFSTVMSATGDDVKSQKGGPSDEGQVTEAEREQAKAMLRTLQDVCLLALRSPVMRDIRSALLLLAESDAVKTALKHTLSASFSQKDLTSEALSSFLEASSILPRLLSCYSAPSVEAGVEQYFHMVTVIAAQLYLCRIHRSESASTSASSPEAAAAPNDHRLPLSSCEFLSMALLAAVEPAEWATSQHKIVPALEAVAGLGPAILAVTPTTATTKDRSALYTYFSQCDGGSRFLVLAVEDMSRTFPTYRPCLFHTTFSYEALQQLFHALLTSLLRVPDGEAEANAAITDILRPVAIKLAVAGMTPRDCDLFGISLCRVMRAPGFPEREWIAFFMEMMDRLVGFLPTVRPLETYTDGDVRRIVRVQRAIRSLLVRRGKASFEGSAPPPPPKQQHERRGNPSRKDRARRTESKV